MKKRVLVFLLFICSISMIGQQYPVQILATVQGPAPVNLYNYADDTSLNSPITVQIFLNDLTISNRQIKLKTYFEGGNIQFQSKDFVLGAENLFIDGGIPLMLRNTELAPYYKYENIQGIGSATYGQSIPEGSYDFCFEVFDYLTGSKLSAKKCVKVFIFKNEPPLLNVPFNGSNIEPKDFENIVFQWTPRHLNVSNVEYELSIVEIWDNNVSPQTAFLSQIPIYQETTRATSILYGPDKPQLLPDKRYAWRVQAKALQGLEEIGLFKNEGYSEVFWFSRTAPCKAPEGISAEPKGLTKINVYWNEDPTEYSDYIIAYREVDKPDAYWFTKKTNSAWATIWNLKAGTTYEYKVKGKCTYQYSEYSEIQHVTTDIVTNDDANYQCGIVPDAIAITNREPHPGLIVGSQIMAGDFNVVVTEITSQSPGALSGKGYVSIPYLNFAKFAVNFNNILVNTDNQLAQGEIVTVYDAKFGEGASMTVDVNVNISEGIKGDSVDMEDSVTVDFVIDSIEIDANGGILIKGSNGETDTAVVPGDGDINIISSNGDVWSVGEDGTITKQDGAEGGAVTADNTNGINSNGQVSEVTANGVLVTFEKSGYYSYDALPENTSSELTAEYKVIETKNGNKYKIPYKAVSDNNGEDFIYANVDISDSSINKKDIIFKTKDGAKVLIDSSYKDNDRVKLKLPRKFHYVNEDIYATIKNKEGKYDIAGALTTTHLASQELEPINVVLVPVGAKITDGLIAKTKEIYDKAGVRLNIEIKEEVDLAEISNWDLDGNNRLEVGDSKILSHYTKEEKAFNRYIKNKTYYNKKTYYVFVTNISVTKDVDGFMPLKRQFGFVFTANANTIDKQTKTLAHELGHGIFGLEHTWDEYNSSQGVTNFLMDYGNGTVLNHLDWKKLHAPGIQLYWFQGDEDGENTSSSNFSEAEALLGESLIDVDDVLEVNSGNTNTSEYNIYIAPSGLPVSLPKGTPVSFIWNNKYKLPKGVLRSFTTDSTYYAVSYNNQFRGYKTAPGKKAYDEFHEITNTSEVKVIVPAKLSFQGACEYMNFTYIYKNPIINSTGKGDFIEVFRLESGRILEDAVFYNTCLPKLNYENFSNNVWGKYNFYNNGGYLSLVANNSGTSSYVYSGTFGVNGEIVYLQYNKGTGIWQNITAPLPNCLSCDINWVIRNLYSADLGHFVLDTAGMVPVAGELFDALNGVWYIIEGDRINATISFASTIPLVYATTIKNIGRIIKLSDGTYTAIKLSTNATETLIGTLKNLNLSDDTLKILFKDLQNTNLTKALAENPKLIDAWETIIGNPMIRKDIKALESVSKIIDNANLTNVISKTDLSNIVNKLAQKGVKCRTCTGGNSAFKYLDEILDDIEFGAVKYGDEYTSVLTGFKQGGNFAEGAMFVASSLKKYPNDFPVVTVFEFTEVTVGGVRRVDVRVNNTFFEFKSVALTNGMPPSGFANQFIKDLQLANVNDLSQIKWWFDASKTSSLSKTDFLSALQQSNIDLLTLNKFVPGVSDVNQARQLFFTELSSNFNTIFSLK